MKSNAMNLETLKLSHQEIGVSKHIHITHLNEPTVFECDNGQLGSVLILQGVSFDTATESELNHYKYIKHQAITMLGELFCIYEHTFRQKLDMKLTGEFEEPFTKTVNELYTEQFKQRNIYQNNLYITLLYKGVDSSKFGKSLNVFQRISEKAVKGARQKYRVKAIGQLKKAVQQLKSLLSQFKPALLGERDDEVGYSELLSFFSQFINNFNDIRFKRPFYAEPVKTSIHITDSELKKYLQGNIAYYLPSKRLYFGDYIEFQGANGQSKFGSMISVKTYGTDTASIMLDKLLQIDCEFITTNTFAIEPNEVALTKISRQLTKLVNANDPAFSQQEQLVQCRDDLASGRLKIGYHHNTVMLIADTLEVLKDQVLRVIKLYAEIGFGAIQETLGMEAAFWAQIPGNQKYIVRSSLITSQNFVDFCPLHNYKTGYRDGNHLGASVTLIETPSRTPMFFNFHTKGSGDKNDLTPGHTTIIGGNGSGKTVFMGFMDSQMSRYGGRSFFFDRDRGMEIYIRACGGTYAIISPDYPSDTCFNPFWLADTPKNRSFLKAWLGQLVREPQEEGLPAQVESALSNCVDYAYDSLSQDHRNLTTATKLLPLDFPRWDHLRKWLRGDGINNAGEYAYLFDHDTDQFDLKTSKIGFDMTELMQQPNSILTAVCMYLMHRIKESLDGQRVSLYFDEGWQILDNPYWKVQLKQDLPTLRKLNAHIILATQSPESVVNSSLSAQFLDNCATNIFFCNHKANFEKHYQQFNVTSSEFDFIKNTPREQRLFLYKQSYESAVCQLNLRGMDDILAVYSGNKATVKLLETIRKEVGDDPQIWLPIFHERRNAKEITS